MSGAGSDAVYLVRCQHYPWLLPVHQSSLLLRLPGHPPTLLGTCYHLQQTTVLAQYKSMIMLFIALLSQTMLLVLLLPVHQLSLLLRLPKRPPTAFGNTLPPTASIVLAQHEKYKHAVCCTAVRSPSSLELLREATIALSACCKTASSSPLGSSTSESVMVPDRSICASIMMF